MSATDRSEVRQYVVRSKTPSNSEKVLLYLRGMERIPPSVPVVDEEQDPNFVPPGSDDIPDHHPLSPRSKATEPDRRATIESQTTNISYTDAGRPQPISPSQAGFNQPELRMPDPKHISDQSWQSWGNKGPLPNDANRSTGGADLGMSWGGHAVFPPQQPNQYSFSASGYPAGPTSGAASPQPIQINLTIVPPSDKTSHTGSRASGLHHDDIPEIEDDDLGDLRGPSRYESHSAVGGSNHPSRRPSSAVASQPAAEGFGDWEAVDHPGREPSHAPSGRPLMDELNAAQARASQTRTPGGQSRAPGGKPVSNAPSTRPPPSAVRPPGSYAPGSAAPGQRPAGSQFGGSRATQMHPLSNRMPSEAPGGRPRAASPANNADYQPLIFASASGVSAVPSAPPHPDTFRYHVQSPTTNEDFMNEEEEEMVHELLTRTPRTSYTVTPSVLAAEVQHSHHHDEDLCVLLHAADDTGMHEIVKRAVRKAIRSRLKKLGMKGDNDAIRAYRDVHNWEFHTERPSNGKQGGLGDDQDAPPPWARQLLDALRQSQERLAVVEKQLQQSKRHEPEHEEDDVRSNATARPEGSVDERHRRLSDVSEFPRGDYGVGSPLIRGETELDATEHMTQGPFESMHHHDDSHFAPDSRRGGENLDAIGVGMRNIGGQTPPHQDGGARHALRDFMRSDQGSLGDQVYEQELYKLRMKPTRTGATHQTWDMTRADPGELMPEIPDSDAGFQGGDPYHDQRGHSPGPVKDDAHNWQTPAPAAWQRIHQTLLDWAVAWSPSELDKALNSTTRGNQVDSLALSVWTMQTYKRYVRLKLSENPPGNIDKMFVPPIIADVVSNAVFSGRHAEASDQLRKLWNDFGLKGSPRQIIVLAPNKRQENHWVVHRFDLSECTLNTYDTSIEKSPPDSRPLGWWFAIKAAFPSVPAPQSGHLYQNHVRMPRPLQYIIDNSVAAAAIWRNLLMSAKAERAIDLERLRDLINTEVKNLRQRKEMGKLTAAVHTLAWEQVGS